MKHIIRRIAWICLGLLLLVTIGISALVIWLQSSAGSRFLLEKAQSVFHQPGEHLSFEDGSIRLLSGFHFKNLRLGWHRGGLDVEAEIAALDLDYHVSLSPRALEITDFVVEHPVLRVKKTAPAKEQASEKSAGSYDKWLENPPAEFALRQLRVHDLDLDYESLGEKESQKVKLRKFNLSAALHLKAGDLQASGEMGFEPKAPPVEIVMTGETAAQTHLDFAGKWQAQIVRVSGRWNYEVAPIDFRAHLAGTTASAGTTAFDLPDARADLGLKLKAESAKLFSFSEERDHAGNDEGLESVEGHADLELANLRLRKQGVTIASATAVQAQLKAALKQTLNYDLAADLKGVSMPASLTRAIVAKASIKGESAPDFSRSEFTSAMDLENFRIFDLKAKLEPDGAAWRGRGDLQLHLPVQLAELVKAAASLKKTGDVNLTGEFDAHLASDATEVTFNAQIPSLKPTALASPAQLSAAGSLRYSALDGKKDVRFKGDLEAINAEYGHWKLASDLAFSQATGSTQTDGVSTIDQVARGTSAKLPALFSKPFKLTHHVRLDAKHADVDVRAEVPHLEIPKFGEVDDTDLRLTAHSPDLAGLKDIDFEARLSQGPLRLAQAPAEGMPNKIAGLAILAKGRVRGGFEGQLNLDTFEGDFDHSAITVRAQGSADAKKKNAQGTADLSLEIPKDFPALAGQRLAGHVRVPLRLSVFRGREISLDGAIAFDDLSWAKGDLSLAGINGRFPYSEKLLWDGKQIKFMELITQNPFERVDFERVRPMLKGAEPLHVQKITWDGKVYGPFDGFFSLKQNLLFAHQFDLDLMSGHLGGEMFFDIYPANLQFGLLSRLTGLNLAEALPAKYVSRLPGGDPIVSARSGFVLNVRTGSIDGRIDVTQIGAPQLVAMINVLDPTYQDEKLNKVRGLLAYGYPTSVALAFADGYMDMNLGLNVLGLAQDEDVREIPVASEISKAVAPIREKTEKGPLQ